MWCALLRHLKVPERRDRCTPCSAQLFLLVAIEQAEIWRIFRGDEKRNRFLVSLSAVYAQVRCIETHVPLCLNVLAVAMARLVSRHKDQPLLGSCRLLRQLSFPILHGDLLDLFGGDLSSAGIQNVRESLLRCKGLGLVEPSRRPIYPFLSVGGCQQRQEEKCREIHD